MIRTAKTLCSGSTPAAAFNFSANSISECAFLGWFVRGSHSCDLREEIRPLGRESRHPEAAAPSALVINERQPVLR